jgi:hypothetical protein
LSAVVTTKNGEKFSGIFSAASLEPGESSFTLKMVQRAAAAEEQRAHGLSDVASPFLGSRPDHSMTFDATEIADVAVANVSTSEVIAKESNGMSSNE